MLPTFSVAGHSELIPILPEEVSTTREIWLNVHNDLEFSPRIRPVRLFLKNLFKGEPAMQIGCDLDNSLPLPDPTQDRASAAMSAHTSPRCSFKFVGEYQRSDALPNS